jgi:quinol monooxygenase YgiN
MAEALTYTRLSTKPNRQEGRIMVRHVVMLKFKPEVSQEQQVELAKMSVEALGKIPGVKNIIAGQALDIGGKPEFDGVLFVDFADEDSFKAYLENPMHKLAEAQLPAMCSDIKIMNFLY